MSTSHSLHFNQNTQSQTQITPLTPTSQQFPTFTLQNQHKFQPTKPVVYINQVKSDVEKSRTTSESAPQPMTITKSNSINAAPFIPKAQREKKALIIKRPDTGEAVKIGGGEAPAPLFTPNPQTVTQPTGDAPKEKLAPREKKVISIRRPDDNSVIVVKKQESVKKAEEKASADKTEEVNEQKVELKEENKENIEKVVESIEKLDIDEAPSEKVSKGGSPSAASALVESLDFDEKKDNKPKPGLLGESPQESLLKNDQIKEKKVIVSFGKVLLRRFETGQINNRRYAHFNFGQK